MQRADSAVTDPEDAMDPKTESCAGTTTDDDTGSEGSVLSAHNSQIDPTRANEPPRVYQQANHRHDFKRQTMTGIEMEEAYPGALDHVSSLNPEYFSLPHGTRVINIKTDVAGNVQNAVRARKWSTLKKVSERIMEIWDARKHSGEKVMFLFAVNGHRHYCGLAEMSGPWEPDDTMEGWEEGKKGACCVGTIPLTWHFFKNVSYELFHHIHQKRNGQPVINMWNGMHIEGETIGEVMRVYITAPHMTNLLAWPRQQGYHQMRIPYVGNYDRHLAAQHNAGVPAFGGPSGRRPVPNVREVRGGRGGRGFAGNTYYTRRNNPALASNNWRETQPQDQRVIDNDQDEDTHEEAFPTAPSQTPVSFVGNAPSARFDGSFEPGVAGGPGEVVSFVIDKHNRLIPITPRHVDGSLLIPSQHYGQQAMMHALDDGQVYSGQHGLYRGSGRGGARGSPFNGMRGGAVRGAKSFNDMRGLRQPADMLVSPHIAEETSESSADSSNDSVARKLRHAASAAALTTDSDWFKSIEVPIQQKPSDAAVARHDSAIAEALSQAPGENNLQRAGTTSKPAPPSQSSFSLRNAAAAPEFVPQAKQSHAIHPSAGSCNFKGSTRSDDSYPSYFKSADSMAGFDPFIGSKPALRLEKDYRPTTRMQKVFDEKMGTPTPASRSGSSIAKGNVRDWQRSLPFPAASSTDPAARESLPASNPKSGFALPAYAKHLTNAQRMTLFTLMAEKGRLEDQIAEAAETEGVEYFELMAKHAEKADMIERLIGDHGDREAGIEKRRGSAAAFSTSSVQRFNISPERRSDGQPLYSVSMRGSPPPQVGSRRGRESRHTPFTQSWDARVTDSTLKVLESPTSSIAVIAGSKPPSPKDADPASPHEPETVRKVYGHLRAPSEMGSETGSATSTDPDDGTGGIPLDS